ncbi:hypothetical protein [Mycobacterium sp. 1423905.2]|uniref:hypothetical protein n=1 Tax=Mycobacterium sp. 1423905.2 TaxID=1856859 RepID=UPI0007FEF120|nr:hypothetical protein [Mycobacterium sp. 1423905.2]OBJ50846.1 hypothetical protein A9W95_22640 [Mycobacterium sp. 1423905.2]
MVTVGALTVVHDLRPAHWLTDHIRTFAYNVGSLLPDMFDGYARLFHPAYDGGTPIRWTEIARANGKTAHPQMQFNRLIGFASRYVVGYHGEQPGLFDEAPAIGTLPAATARILVRTFARHTPDPDDCWFAVWDGWGSLDAAFGDRPTFGLPARNYHLAHGPLAAAAQSVAAQPWPHTSCNLWWPADHAWCVATDIDLDSTYIGASHACIEELLTNKDLETAPLDISAGITADSDTLNPVFGC